MAGRRRGELSADLARAAARFAQWRRTRVLGERIPGALWRLAVELAGREGVSRTATALRVGYYELQRRTAATEPGRNSAPSPSPAFVELPGGLVTGPGECLIEWERASGERLRIRLQGLPTPDVVALGRSFWGTG